MKGELEDTVQHIYDAILDDDALGRLGETFANLLGATSCWFPVTEKATGATRVISSFNIPSEALAPYQAYYHQFDPWLEIGMIAPPDRAFLSEHHITSTEFKELQVFADYVKPYFGNATRLLGAPMPIGGEIAFVGMHRQDGQGAFAEQALHILDRLLPPLRRLLTVRKMLDAANARAANLEETLDKMSAGILRCHADGKIAYANQRALTFLFKQDGLRGLIGGRFHTSNSAETALLHQLIQRAASEKAPSSGAMLVARVSGSSPYQVVVVPFRPPDGGRRTALVMVRDMQRPTPNLRTYVQALYQLTNAETDVAMALVGGATPEEYAEARAVSITTVRTQIRSVLNKAGLRRQIDLVSTIAGLPVLEG